MIHIFININQTWFLKPLIITEITPLGILMVADNAITISCSEPDGTVQDRSFKGLRKLVPISKIQAG